MRPDQLCGLLAEPDRLQAYAAVVLGAHSPSEVAQRTGLPARSVVAALRRLEQGGLVATVDGRLVAEATAFKDAVRERGRGSPPQQPLDADHQRDAVLRAFIVDGRLRQLPAARGKRRVVLEHIVTCFEPGVKYPERAVNAILRVWHPDHASLRRYLVDDGLMAREGGMYWRTGGYVDI
jgi:hypothetical protein